MDSLGQYQVVRVKNPFNEPFYYQWDGFQYEPIPANGEVFLPSFLAKHVAKKMAQKKIIETRGVGFKGLLRRSHVKSLAESFLVEVGKTVGNNTKKTQGEIVNEHIQFLNKQASGKNEEEFAALVALNTPEEAGKSVEADGKNAALDITTEESDEDIDVDKIMEDEKKANNPIGFRLEELHKLKINDLRKLLGEKGGNVMPGMDKSQIVDAIVKIEFDLE